MVSIREIGLCRIRGSCRSPTPATAPEGRDVAGGEFACREEYGPEYGVRAGYFSFASPEPTIPPLPVGRQPMDMLTAVEAVEAVDCHEEGKVFG